MFRKKKASGFLGALILALALLPALDQPGAQQLDQLSTQNLVQDGPATADLIILAGMAEGDEDIEEFGLFGHLTGLLAIAIGEGGKRWGFMAVLGGQLVTAGAITIGIAA